MSLKKSSKNREFIDPFTAEIKLLDSLKNVKTYKKQNKIFKNKIKNNDTQQTKHEWKTYLPGFVTNEPKQLKRERDAERKLYEMEARMLSYDIKPAISHLNNQRLSGKDSNYGTNDGLPFEIHKPKTFAFDNSKVIKDLLEERRYKHLNAEKDYKEIKIAVIKEIESEITLNTRILKDDMENLDEQLNDIMKRIKSNDNSDENEIDKYWEKIENNYNERSKLYHEYLKKMSEEMETKRKKLLEEELIRLVKRWRNIGHQLLPDIQRSLINEAQSINKEILQNQGYYLELITKLKIKDLRSKQKQEQIIAELKRKLLPETEPPTQNDNDSNEEANK